MAIITGNTCLQLDMFERPATVGVVRPGRGQVRGVTASAWPEPELGYYIAPGTGGHGRARADGLLAVIQTFVCGVGVFGYDATRSDKFLIMVAARPVLDALDLLLPSIAVQMETAARAAARTCSDSAQTTLARTRYFRNYLRGYGQGMAETIRGIRTEYIATAGNGLLRFLAEQHVRAEEVYSRDFPDTIAMRPERVGHTAGLEEGRDAGRFADLADEYIAKHDLVFAML